MRGEEKGTDRVQPKQEASLVEPQNGQSVQEGKVEERWVERLLSAELKAFAV